MTHIHYQNAQFLLSVAKPEQLPPDQGIEIAFAGRSNAGKSSVLNRITQQKNLARVSNTPGRTQLINYFIVNDTVQLVDLPGYGYAKVPPNVKKDWEALIDYYLRSRQSLKGLIMVMDIRHPFRDFDQQLLAWCNQCELPVHILLNKADKLTKSQIMQTMLQVKQKVIPYTNSVSYQAFSAVKMIGIDELRKKLDDWVSNPPK